MASTVSAGSGSGVGSGRGRERLEDARAEQPVLGLTAPERARRPGQHARFLHQFVGTELLAGQVDVDPGQPVPPVEALPRAVGAVHLRHAQVAAEQVVQHQRGRPALPAGGVGRRPARDVGRVLADVDTPGGADRPFDLAQAGRERHVGNLGPAGDRTPG